MKFLVTNDWHLSSRAPSSRLDNYQDELFELLDQIALLAVKLQAHVVVPGDIFHTAGGVSWSLFMRILLWGRSLTDQGLQILAVPGNHDLKFNRLDTLADLPLGVLFKMGVFTDVSYRPVTLAGVTFYGVPFPDSFDPKIWNNPSLTQPQTPPAVLLTHCFASPTGGDYFGEPVWRYDDLAKLPFEVFCFGHDHSDGGINEVAGKYFINLGALSRGSIAHDDITRDLKVALVEVDGYQNCEPGDERRRPTTVKLIRLKFRPAAELFDLQRKAELDAEKRQIEQFVETLDAQLMSAPAAGMLSERVTQLGLTHAVRERVLAYLEQTP